MEFMWARPGQLVPYIQHRAELRLQPISIQKRVGEIFEEAIQEVRAVSAFISPIRPIWSSGAPPKSLAQAVK